MVQTMEAGEFMILTIVLRKIRLFPGNQRESGLRAF